MKNSTTIEFDVTPTAPEWPLSLTVKMNDNVVWQQTQVTESCHVTVAIDDSVDAEHTLRWIIENKKPEHTKIDDSGVITQDSMIRIDNVIIDEIDITNYLHAMATYAHDYNGSSDPVVDKMYPDLGCNGIAELKFSTPVYLWLLENI